MTDSNISISQGYGTKLATDVDANGVHTLKTTGGGGAGGSVTITGAVQNSSATSVITGLAAAQAINNNTLDSSGAGAWTDVSAYQSMVLSVNATSPGGYFAIELSDDGVTPSTRAYYHNSSNPATPNTADVMALMGLATYYVKIPTRFVRVRISTALTGTASFKATLVGPELIAPSGHQPVSTAPQRLFITGLTGAQAVNNNILDASGGGGWTDTQGNPTMIFRITASASGGVIQFDLSEDGTATSATYCTPYVGTAGSAWTTSIATVPTAGSYIVQTHARYVRARITTALTGTASCSASFLPYRMEGQNGGAVWVANATASNLQAVVSGGAADSATAAGNPVQVAGKVFTAVDTSYAAGEIGALPVSTGKQVVTKAFAPAELDWQYAAPIAGTAYAAATNVAVKPAGAASVRNYVTALQGVVPTATTVTIVDGTSTSLWSKTCAAGENLNIQFPTPLRGTAATAMNIQLSAAQTAWLNVQGFQSF